MTSFRSISVSYTIPHIFVKKKAVSSCTRAQMIALHYAGFNEAEISKQLIISHRCVHNAINKYEHLGIYDNSKRSARPKKLDEWDFRHLKRLVKGDACLNVTKIASDLNASLPKPVTTRTIHT